MEIHLFGATTAIGESLRQIHQTSADSSRLFCYSRSSYGQKCNFSFVDLSDPGSFVFKGESVSQKIWISFVPVWLFAPFFEKIACLYHEQLVGLRGLVTCSSSSVITKRFASNKFDRELFFRLKNSEDQLLTTCKALNVGCHILQPTLIYGQAGPYGDRNLSHLLNQLRRFPLLPLPADTGLRQPIHASQLAAVALHLAQHLSVPAVDMSVPERIALGGDSTLTYTEMIRALQRSQPPTDSARSCHLLSIPNRLFFLVAALLLIRSPKAFEAVLRMGANLSGFTPAYQILGSEVQPFPVQPLS